MSLTCETSVVKERALLLRTCRPGGESYGTPARVESCRMSRTD